MPEHVDSPKEACEGATIVVYKDMGLVSQVFDQQKLSSLPGHIAIGHVRYSTTGSSLWENAQPTYKTAGNLEIALGHNGNLINTRELSELAGEPSDSFGPDATSDTDVIASLIADSGKENAEEAIMEVLPMLTGAFSLVLMDTRTLFGARDSYGLRPLVLGRLKEGYALASETCALDIIGATFIREVEPGELVIIDERGLRPRRFD